MYDLVIEVAKDNLFGKLKETEQVNLYDFFFYLDRKRYYQKLELEAIKKK